MLATAALLVTVVAAGSCSRHTPAGAETGTPAAQPSASCAPAPTNPELRPGDCLATAVPGQPGTRLTLAEFVVAFGSSTRITYGRTHLACVNVGLINRRVTAATVQAADFGLSVNGRLTPGEPGPANGLPARLLAGGGSEAGVVCWPDRSTRGGYVYFAPSAFGSVRGVAPVTFAG